MSGAKALFREVGYERASVDAIAARAGVSKATIYNHFRSKEALFFCAYSSETERLRETFLGLLEAPTGDIESDLHQIGKELLRLVCAPSNVLHHRVVIGEAGRFPELGQALYDCGLRAGRERMTCFFERAGALGLLEMDDPASAAVNFAALVLGDLFKELQLAVRQDVSEQVIDENVRRGVRTFLRAYLPFSSRTEYIGAAFHPRLRQRSRPPASTLACLRDGAATAHDTVDALDPAVAAPWFGSLPGFSNDFRAVAAPNCCSRRSGTPHRARRGRGSTGIDSRCTLKAQMHTESGELVEDDR